MRPEAELVTAAQGGDEAAFEALLHQYENQVFTLARRICGNPDDAAEAAQEAFLSAWQGLRFFRQEANFSTWLYRLTSNACIDLLRREKRQRVSFSFDEEGCTLEVTDSAPTPEQALEQKDLRAGIEQGLDALTDEHRQVLVLRELHQLSYDEIADVLDLDVGTVKSRISRGRGQLRKFLLKNGNFFSPAPSNPREVEGCK
ncbi:MAG: RNA polymerase sigma factor [Oscillospiraceae bacterium]